MTTKTSPTPTPEFAAAYRDHILGVLQHERELTRKVFDAIPKGKNDYKPDPKSRTALEIATHLAESDVWFLTSIADGKFEFDPTKQLPPFKSGAEVNAWYDKNLPAAFERVKKLDGKNLAASLEFFGMTFPLYHYLLFSLNHTVHHRAQIATYLRAMGGKVPDIYGGSADEPFQG